MNLYLRFLVLRNREYNGDLSFDHLEIQGRSYDEAQALTLGTFSCNFCPEELINRLNSQKLCHCFFILRGISNAALQLNFQSSRYIHFMSYSIKLKAIN